MVFHGTASVYNFEEKQSTYLDSIKLRKHISYLRKSQCLWLQFNEGPGY
jgi:hypothetical protein